MIEDPEAYGYYREEGGGLLVGMFEPVGAGVVAGRHAEGVARSPCCRPTGTGSRRSSRWR